MGMGTLKQDLLSPGVELRETHISRVFLTADTAYKLKKPVQLGFLDFHTLEQRKHFCEVEVQLNRRLAQRVYRGVVPITRDVSGVHHLGVGAGDIVDYAVEMDRLPDADAADQRLERGLLGALELTRIAEHLARFHAAARCDEETERYGQRAAIEVNVRENFEQTRQSARACLSETELQNIERWQTQFLQLEEARFDARIAAKRVRDGHGDLRLAHCYLAADETVQIIDCIEFNDRFRYGDVCADVAFLAMDLAWNERPDLSEAFLASYARAADDYELYSVVDFYESYRAYVRGKVSSLLAEDTGADEAVRERARIEARKYYLLAEACTKPLMQAPQLYAVGGVIASGKSSVAGRLAGMLNAPHIEADRTRKRLAGLDPLTPSPDAAFSGNYTPEKTQAVYAELRRRAELVLRSGRSVVIDASFRERSQRTALTELAQRVGCGLTFIECFAPAELCRERLRKRATRPSVSDGRSEIFDSFVRSYEPVTELSASQHVRLDTSPEKARVDVRLRALITAS
jgi:aminoglycoside phosphotransferase family enzyme/predicted kinase